MALSKNAIILLLNNWVTQGRTQMWINAQLDALMKEFQEGEGQHDATRPGIDPAVFDSIVGGDVPLGAGISTTPPKATFSEALAQTISDYTASVRVGRPFSQPVVRERLAGLTGLGPTAPGLDSLVTAFNTQVRSSEAIQRIEEERGAEQDRQAFLAKQAQFGDSTRPPIGSISATLERYLYDPGYNSGDVQRDVTRITNDPRYYFDNVARRVQALGPEKGRLQTLASSSGTDTKAAEERVAAIEAFVANAEQARAAVGTANIIDPTSVTTAGTGTGTSGQVLSGTAGTLGTTTGGGGGGQPSQFNVDLGFLGADNAQADTLEDLNAIVRKEREATQEGRNLELLDFLNRTTNFSNLSPIIQNPLSRAVGSGADLTSQFFTQLFGQGSGSGQVPQRTFASFLEGGLPNANVLQGGLQNITAQLGQGGDTNFMRALQGVFQDPTETFNAALQPGLERISPAIRNAFRNRATQGFQSQLASDPTRFATPAQSFRHFNQAGFF